MTISNIQVKLLESYRDKAYITCILCTQSSEYFSFLRSMVNIPLILSSSVMTVLNSMSESNNDNMKYVNIILNAWTSLILSMIGNFKISEQETNFKSIAVKMNKLTHKIEDSLTNDIDNCTTEHIRTIINEYDSLNENIDFGFPNFIKNRVKNTYAGKKTLPNILSCEISFISVETETINNC